MRLLTPGVSNPKTVKSEKDGRYHVAILHLAPADMSGQNVCPMASNGCRMACLAYAGHGGIIRHDSPDGLSDVNRARIRRTKRFHADRAGFLTDLVKDVEAVVRKAARLGKRPAVRLNGTSDIRWESIPVTRAGRRYPHIFAAFPTVTFYDYTKISNRRIHEIPNYSLTFSLSENNDRHAILASQNGMNVAVVFDVPTANRFRPAGKLPASWGGIPVIDGDTSDLRFHDPRGVIVGLRAKGARGKADTTGFVRSTTDGGFDAARTPRAYTQPETRAA
jgi:hypothetical protein